MDIENDKMKNIEDSCNQNNDIKEESMDVNDKTKTSKNSFGANIAKGVGKKIVEVVLILVLLIGGWYFIKANPFNWNFSFGNSELKIDKTANVVEKIKNISEFTTICYYEETVIKNSKAVDASNIVTDWLKLKTDSIQEEIVIIAKGKVRAGFNFSKIKENDIIVKTDTISIKLPSPEVFDVIANPSDYEIFVEEGKWSHEDISLLQMDHRNQLLKSSIESGVLQKAMSVGEIKISELFKTFGFKTVIIEMSDIEM